jgi:hypothetical protein
MKRSIALAGALAVAAAYFVLSALPAFGGDSATVEANVTVAAPCITVTVTWPSAPKLDFGPRLFTTPTQPGGTGLSGALSITNCATGFENVLVRGTDATSPTTAATWQLQGSVDTCSAGVDKYALETTLADANGGNSLPSTAVEKTNKLLGNIGPGTRTASPRIWMPCTGSSGAGETMSFQFVYTASL